MNTFVLSSLPIISENSEALLRDMGDGVGCVEFRSKGNSVSAAVKEFMLELLERDLAGLDGLVIGSQSKNFSVGANLINMLKNIEQGDYAEIERNVHMLQTLNMKMKHYHKPIVAATYRNTLGGGLELALHCARRVALAKSYMGLVEVGVGLVPAGGGLKECAMQVGQARAETVMTVMETVFDRILLRRISTSAQNARELLYLSQNDPIIEESDALIPAAKSECMRLIDIGRAAATEEAVTLPGEAGRAILSEHLLALREQGCVGDYDMHIGGMLASVLSGGYAAGAVTLSEQELLHLECECFMELVHSRGTEERIRYFLAHNSYLHN